MSAAAPTPAGPGPGPGPDPNPALPLPRRELLTESIADAIAEAIATRHLAPGMRVVETTLARSYQTSRVPVREALKILHTQGILTGGGHRGYRVAEFNARRVAQVAEVRLLLEVVLWRDTLARWRRDGPQLAPLEAVIGRMEMAARGQDFRAMLTCDLEFHRAICVQADNDIAYSAWNNIARHTLIIFNLARHRDRDLGFVVQRHRILLDRLRRDGDEPLDEAGLSALLREHIDGNRMRLADDEQPAQTPPASAGAR
jgi:DNA-binding GntR family transcriptional regulator